MIKFPNKCLRDFNSRFLRDESLSSRQLRSIAEGITTEHDFEVIWRIKLSDDFFYFLKTDIVEDKYQKLTERLI